MGSIDFPVLRRLLDAGAQLVEVLPAPEYAEMHLPGAVNIPLKTLDATTTAPDHLVRRALPRRGAATPSRWG